MTAPPTPWPVLCRNVWCFNVVSLGRAKPPPQVICLLAIRRAWRQSGMGDEHLLSLQLQILHGEWTLKDSSYVPYAASCRLLAY